MKAIKVRIIVKSPEAIIGRRDGPPFDVGGEAEFCSSHSMALHRIAQFGVSGKLLVDESVSPP
jgi:hypothetical protein